VKPNRAELEALLGRDLPTIADIVTAARSLLDRGVALVVVSLGAAGALFVDREAALAAALPAKKALSTVGAGDAMVAGIAAANGRRRVARAPRPPRGRFRQLEARPDRAVSWPGRRCRTPRRRGSRERADDLICRLQQGREPPARRKRTMSKLIAVVAATDRPTQAMLAPKR